MTWRRTWTAADEPAAPDHVLHCTRPAGAASGMIDVVRDGPGRRALRSSAEGFFPCLLNLMQPSTKSSVSFSRSPWNASASECLRRSNASLPTVARVPTSAYQAVFELIDAGTASSGKAFDNPRRSTAVQQLLCIQSQELLTKEELDRFSPETRAVVESLLG